MTYIKHKRWQAALLATALLCGAAAALGAGGTPQNLPAIALQAGMYNIRAAVARTPEQRQLGLMYRRDLAPHEGMLFVFETAAPQCFWMKDTLLPLSIAFLADDGTVINIDEMQPQTLNAHCSKQPVRYVLEMNRGWFAKRGIGPGARLTGIGGKAFGAQ